jgi:predicted RecB family nuclease
MMITSRLLEAYLNCATKCWLTSSREGHADNTFTQFVHAQDEAYRTAAIQLILSEEIRSEYIISPSPHELKYGTWRLATNITAQTPQLQSDLHAVECLRSSTRNKSDKFSAIRFVSANKLGKDARTLLAFDALVLSDVIGQDIGVGKIIHGDDHTTLKANTSALVPGVRALIERIEALLSSPSPPDLVLIPHCAECEFQVRCREKALEKDDLSLLAGMTVKERNKLHEKGIFTVTQLSYTFRPRRRHKRQRDKRDKYYHSLRALAIRQKKIHIVGSPELVIEGTPVYIDVEGLPDRDFYYLIGIRLGEGDSAVQYSLWADRVSEEKRIWQEFLNILASTRNPVLIHYGSYETTFFKRMRDRYSIPLPKSSAAEAIKKSLNLLSVIYSQVYFPTFSNRLKDIGHALGKEWTGPVTSGLQSISFRTEWERTRSTHLKTSLVRYNTDDCAALETVTSRLVQIIRDAASRVDVEFSDRPKSMATEIGTEIHVSLDSILKSAHFDYSHSRIKLLSEDATQVQAVQTKKAKSRPLRRTFSAIKAKIVQVPRRRICPSHPGHKLSASSAYSQHSLIDLVFSKTGCRKTVITYRGLLGCCNLCNERYSPPAIRCLKGQVFGWNFQAFVNYQRIALRMSYSLISKSICDLFSEPLKPGSIGGFSKRFSDYYKHTEELLLRRILDGPVVHLDETMINILGVDQYVWVLTDNSRVVFRLRPNREAGFLKPLLSGFNGIAVTDFYGGYDALPCAQQKCLVHLIRDLNDDLWKNPFDDEFEGFVAAVRDLLIPLLADVQQFGLKVRHLGKHQKRVDRFYRDMITGQPSMRETTRRFRKRFERYKDSLFSFITTDDVPWHNNAAERALRHLAVQRKISGSFSEKGAGEYLRLLSIAQSCRFQHKSFLGFLLSKSRNVDEYKNRGRMHPDLLTDPWERE